MLDEKDAVADRKIAERVIMNHRYQNPNFDPMAHFSFGDTDYVIEPAVREDAKLDGKATTVWEAHTTKTTAGKTTKVVSREFLKKFLSFVKSQKNPEIEGGCIDYAAALYSTLRQKAKYYDQNKVSCPVTVRTLETMLRLATAHSKLRVSKNVTTKDIDIAMNLVHLSIFGCALNDNEDDEDVEMDDTTPVEPKKTNGHTSKVDKSRMEIDQETKRSKRTQFVEEEDYVE
jgi:DNA replication licensing factor MCM3